MRQVRGSDRASTEGCFASTVHIPCRSALSWHRTTVQRPYRPPVVIERDRSRREFLHWGMPFDLPRSSWDAYSARPLVTSEIIGRPDRSENVECGRFLPTTTRSDGCMAH